MSKSFTLDQLTEGIRERHLGAQNRRLVEKWSRTGLLRGLEDVKRENMSRLLENQASQLLKEATTLSNGGGGLVDSGDIRGFTNVAFPIVRRVFGGLVANDLVSIQPMSLPSGLLFYLDYTYGSSVGGGDSGTTSDTYQSGKSIYNNPVGKGIQSGSLGVGGQYDLAGSGYTRVHSTTEGITVTDDAKCVVWAGETAATKASGTGAFSSLAHATGTDGKLIQFDPQVSNLIENESGKFFFVLVPFNTTNFANVDSTLVKDISLTPTGTAFVSGIPGSVAGQGDMAVIPETIQGGRTYNIRRLNQLVTWDGSINSVPSSAPMATNATSNAHVLMVCSGTQPQNDNTYDVSYVLSSQLDSSAGNADTLVVPAFESATSARNLEAESPTIPEIDIKIESIAVTAQTRKLKARWTPELAQDLNAYHSLDAEVELTQILSEQIALELDREILNDLLMQAGGANLYWSRAPGRFVNKETGEEVQRGSTIHPGPAWAGTVREWYETLVETIIDAANQIHRKTLRGSANFIVVGPDVATILESSVFYKPVYSIDGEGQVSAPMTLGAEKVGALSNRFTVYKDPYFPRNKILVGYKGGSYLETGYVYAPYVPLIVTPTIFAPDDFTPRKGVMTRYGKKMVRSDFYGSVTVLDMNII